MVRLEARLVTYWRQQLVSFIGNIGTLYMFFVSGLKRPQNLNCPRSPGKGDFHRQDFDISDRQDFDISVHRGPGTHVTGGQSGSLTGGATLEIGGCTQSTDCMLMLK
ncbi:hypothetical protein CYMTET_42177 [Cymbomonas tetramitiformis]|uniref:Uncharacterized protein n=1 Tax=Cymbomonas tetramitiformis TaxID=36881 RepID=A0AAE0C6K9_9CHLO|nr:hypothetical protein CYMTET_42177 [Cymbomonas tetramitiformis]